MKYESEEQHWEGTIIEATKRDKMLKLEMHVTDEEFDQLLFSLGMKVTLSINEG